MIVSDDARKMSTPYPCGQCLHCRINRARVWTHRLLLEQKSHAASVFVTLTYSDEFIPADSSLEPSDIQLFLKRLRYFLGDRKIRYYVVGEYGTATKRPHYHGALFGIGLEDENLILRSWSKGHVMVGELNEYSARYMTGYVTKGMTKKKDGRLEGRSPEFARMSLKPGLGSAAVEKAAVKLKGFDVDHTVREFQIGRRCYPLGRYLTARLSSLMGQDPNLQASEYWDYQQEMFDKHLGSDIYKDSILNDNAQKRLQQKKRHAIKRGGSL